MVLLSPASRPSEAAQKLPARDALVVRYGRDPLRASRRGSNNYRNLKRGRLDCPHASHARKTLMALALALVRVDVEPASEPTAAPRAGLVGNARGMVPCKAETAGSVGNPETRGDQKGERHETAVGAEQRVRRVSATTTPDNAPSGYPFAGSSDVCMAAEFSVTRRRVLF